MKLPLLLVGLALGRCGYAQWLQPPAATRAGAYGTARMNALHAAANQAALGNLKRFSAAIYGEKTFLLQELSLYHLAVAQHVGDGAFGLQIAYSGDADFNTSKTGLAYGRNLSEKLALGVQFNYWNQKMRGYGNVRHVTIEAATVVHFSETFHAGFQLRNPAGVVLHKAGEKLPAIYTVGFTYQPSQPFGITAEIIKTAHKPIEVQTHLEYRFAPKLWTKAGINSGTTAFYVAAGFQLKDFSIEVVGSVHPHLGFSPGMLLVYNDMGK